MGCATQTAASTPRRRPQAPGIQWAGSLALLSALILPLTLGFTLRQRMFGSMARAAPTEHLPAIMTTDMPIRPDSFWIVLYIRALPCVLKEVRVPFVPLAEAERDKAMSAPERLRPDS